VLTDTDPAAQVLLIGKGDNVPQVLLDAANNVVALSARTPPRTIESRCMDPEVAHFGRHAMSDLSPLLGAERKSRLGAVRSVFDPEPTWTIGHHVVCVVLER